MEFDPERHDMFIASDHIKQWMMTVATDDIGLACGGRFWRLPYLLFESEISMCLSAILYLMIPLTYM
jgi:hypothetical protein